MRDDGTRVESSENVGPLSELAAAPVTLAAPLTIRYGHTGIVGFTGRQIDVECDGSWRLSQAFTSSTGPIIETGKLADTEVKGLLKILTESKGDHSLSTLPDPIGRFGVRGPRATITLGDLKKTAFIRVDGATSLPTLEAQAFREIVTQVQRLLGIDGASEQICSPPKESL
jgi:hypothetical protein